MLDSHRNLLEPRPSDRLRIGDCVLDIPLREIARGDGEPTRITLKAEGVLLVLVANAGKVVGREALLEWVWPDTMPTDDVVTQAVTQLRKAFGNGQPYIETLPKQGYRLLAQVEWLVDEPASQPMAGPAGDAVAARAASRVERSRPPRRVLAIAMAALLVAAVAVALFWSRPQRPAATPSATEAPAATAAATVPMQRVTAFPGAELWPSFSPDGTLLAYSQTRPDGTGAALRLQAPTSATARALTEEANGQWDQYPAWSPDGREIAFVRSGSGACSVMRVATAGGKPRRLGDCLGSRPHPLGWYPDGRGLIASTAAMAMSPGVSVNGVHRMDLDAGRWAPLAYERSESDMDVYPKVSPDGRWIVFQRNVSLGDLWRMPVGGGKPQRLTDVRTNIFGFDWMDGGASLVFSHYTGNGPRLSRLDISSGQVSDYTGSAENLTYPTVAAPGGEVAFIVDDSRSIVQRIDASEASGEDGIAPLFETSTSNLIPGIAPDGRQLAFVSDRTGEQALWWVDQQAPETLRAIEAFQPVPRYPVRWNPGSTRFLAVGAGERGRGLYEVDPRRGQATWLAPPDGQPVHADYHADPDKLLVVADRGQGRLGLALYDRSRTPWRELGRIDDVALALMDRVRGRVVFARMSSAEVWEADAALRNPRRLDRVAFPWLLRSLAVADDGAWVMDARDGCDWWWRPVGGGKDAGRCLRASSPQMLEALSRAPSGDTLFVSVAEDSGSDIGLLPASAFSGPRLVAANR